MNNSKEIQDKIANNLMQGQAGKMTGLCKEGMKPTEPSGFMITIEHKVLGNLQKRTYSREEIVSFFSSFDMENIWGVNIHPVV